MKDKETKIGVVIIGIDVANYLPECIRSVQSVNYPKDCIEIIYVDGGSRDQSTSIARSFEGVRIVELKNRYPTPGRGRNAGWKRLNTPLIQFLDADTILDPDWFQNAVPELKGSTAAVCGSRREKYPEKNIYHMLTNMEWNYEKGPCRYFGGDVLIHRDALEKTGGFDEDLVAGEDPELSYRIRQTNRQILRMDIPMTIHDINMSNSKQYIKRAYRSGYAYAEIGLRFFRNKEKLWARELFRITARAVLPIFLIITGMVFGNIWYGLILGLLITFKPLFSIVRLKKQFQQSWKHTILYGLHSSVVIFPQSLGSFRYLGGRMVGKPLKNKGVV